MKRLNKIIPVSLLLFCIYMLIRIAHISEQNLYYISFMINGFVKVGGFLIIPLIKHVKVDMFYVYFSLYLGGSGVFTILSVVYMSVAGTSFTRELAILSFCLNLMEIIGMMKAIKGVKREYKQVAKNTVTFMSVFLVICIIIFSTHIFENNFEINNFVTFNRIIVIIAFSIFFYIIYFKEFVQVGLKRELLSFIAIKIIYNTSYFLTYDWSYLYFTKIILTLLSGFFIARVLFYFVINKPNETLYLNLKESNKELKKALSELEESSKTIEEDNRYINNIIEFFPEGIAIFDNNKVIFANKQLCEFFNCKDTEELIGADIWDLTHKDYKEKLINLIEDSTLEIERGPQEFILTYNKNEFVGETIATKITKNNKELLLCVIRDITEKKKIEELNLALELKEKEAKMKNELMANLSHEFKTPVNIIYSSIQMQEVYHKSNDINGVMKFNSMMKQNCFRLLRLINNFIDATKYENNIENQVNLKAMNIVSFVENIVMCSIPYCNENDISIIFDTVNEDIFANIDPQLLDRVILNLLSNAIKYNKTNGSIFVDIKETSTQVLIIVRDTGMGISKENLDKLFNRFERLDMSLSRKREGSGIGLNIVKSLVEVQEGAISVTSEEGVGSTFTLTFPKISIDHVNSEYSEYLFNDLIDKVNLELSDII